MPEHAGKVLIRERFEDKKGEIMTENIMWKDARLEIAKVGAISTKQKKTFLSKSTWRAKSK